MFSIISDGVNTKIGTIFSDYKYFYSWNTKNTKKNKKGFSSLTNVIEGPLSRKNIVSIISNFIYFPDRSSEHEKYLSRYPQFYGAKDIYQSVLKNKRPHGNGKGGTYFGATGVVKHSQCFT